MQVLLIVFMAQIHDLQVTLAKMYSVVEPWCLTPARAGRKVVGLLCCKLHHNLEVICNWDPDDNLTKYVIIKKGKTHPFRATYRPPYHQYK